MGTELSARAVRRQAPGGHSPWREVLPRVEAYLQASGVVDDHRVPLALAEIEGRLHGCLPLRDGEQPAEVAMRETVRWVEARRADTGGCLPPPCPERAGRDMPEQRIELGGRRRRDRTAADSPGSATEAGDARGPARGIRLRRTLWLALIALTTTGAVALMSGSMLQNGLSPLELFLILLYAVLFAWICAAFWTAFMGFVVRACGIRRWDIESCLDRRGKGSAAKQHCAPCALIMPIYNEAPGPVYARLRAMWESLAAADPRHPFDFYILSDTRDPDVQVAEELGWARLCAETGGAGHIFYRHRQDNHHRKAGNIADFVRSWGGRYKYMAVLDADSLMGGATLLRMVEMMEALPRVAILQAPPMPVNSRSLFARLLQFASALYGPLYTAGANFWQAGEASYFGHNALIRVEPFARHCGLPELPGREPLGGPILSHDFVEAATLRRAGWETWLAPGLEESLEELPPTLIDYAKRDRRWCQGNLQHGRLVTARAWRGLSRLHFGMAVMSYLASPLWFLFLLAAGVEAWLQSRETPVYFFGHSLFPVWPTSYAFELMTVLVVTLSILFLPKVLALVLMFADRRQWAGYGGRSRAALSALLETLFSVIVAPVLMLFQTRFVVSILLRRNVGWPAQQRADRVTTLREAFAAHGLHLATGILAGLCAWYWVPAFFWWFTPVLAGLLLAVPVSMLTSRADLGDAARRLGLFLTPQEVRPSDIVRRYRAALDESAPACEALPDPWLAALLHPRVHALHCQMLPREEPSRRERLHSEALMYALADQSEEVLDTADRRALLANAQCLERVHVGLWAELPLTRLAEAVPEVSLGAVAGMRGYGT